MFYEEQRWPYPQPLIERKQFDVGLDYSGTSSHWLSLLMFCGVR
jgi:hypothetical protein